MGFASKDYVFGRMTEETIERRLKRLDDGDGSAPSLRVRGEAISIEVLKRYCRVNDGGCWEWRYKVVGGYPVLRCREKVINVRAVMFRLADPDLFLADSDVKRLRTFCKSTRCVNPEHIYIETIGVDEGSEHYGDTYEMAALRRETYKYYDKLKRLRISIKNTKKKIKRLFVNNRVHAQEMRVLGLGGKDVPDEPDDLIDAE